MNKNGKTGAGEKASTGEESALSRWSRRKSQSRAPGQDTEEDLQSPPVTTASIADNNPVESASEPLSIATPAAVNEISDEDMPSVESLDENSDYAGFLSAGVSEKLRRAALRKLFHLDVFNVVDGLDDYAEDYTKFEKLGAIITADMRLQKLRAEQALKQEVDTEAPASEQAQENATLPPDVDELEETADLSEDLTEPGQEQDKKVD